MTNFLSDLYNYITELTPEIRGDPEYERALQTCEDLEKEIKKKIGGELLYEYQRARADVSHRGELAVFVQTLRLSCRFWLEVLGQS